MEKEKRMKLIAAIATPIAKSQHMREMWFHVMSGGAMLKIVVMEIARITLDVLGVFMRVETEKMYLYPLSMECIISGSKGN